MTYLSGRRKGPMPRVIGMNKVVANKEDYNEARQKDFGWFLTRLPLTLDLHQLSEEHQQNVPSWTAFNMVLQKGNVPEPSIVSYLPAMHAASTELSTVYTVLKHTLSIADQ